MRKPLRLFVTFASVIVLLAVSTGVTSAAPPVKRAKWTVMVYISGD